MSRVPYRIKKSVRLPGCEYSLDLSVVQAKIGRSLGMRHMPDLVFYIGFPMWGAVMEANRKMAATPEAPMGLIIMMLQRYVEWIREEIAAGRFPEAELDPDWQGPLTPARQSPASPEPCVAQRPASTVTRTPAHPRTSASAQSPARPRTPASTQTPARPRTSSAARTSSPARTQAAPRTPAVPAQRQIPEPVGERHKRRISQDVKIAVSARDGGRCRQCGSTEKLHFDHIIPVSKGGANTVANIQLLCGPCNRAKAANLPGSGPVACCRPARQRLRAGGSWTSGPAVRMRNSA
jgi:5-methylcytosine-specific restriction endonuclease McrA